MDKSRLAMLAAAAGAAVHLLSSARPVVSLQQSCGPLHGEISTASRTRKQVSGSRLYLQNQNKNEDTSTTTDPLLKFADEVLDAESSALLDELREEMMGSDTATTSTNTKIPIVEPPVMFAGEDETTQSFDLSRWENHRSAGRYFRLMPGVLFSVTTRRIAGTVGFLVAWSSLVEMYNSYARMDHDINLPPLQLPIVPFELTAPVLGLLLVFRSDRAFDRFSLGNEASWDISNHCKTICRELLSFTAKERFDAEERMAAYELVEACEILHGLIMKRYLRGKQCIVSPRQAEKFFQKALGRTSAAAGGGSPLQNTNTNSKAKQDTITTQLLPLAPSAAMAAISLGISKRLPSLDEQESTLMEGQMGELQISLGTCEKLLRTPIPLGYTRYSVRFLWAWLYLLPFALVDTFYEFGLKYTWWQDKPQPVLVFAMLFICFIFISIEDISVQIEEPFSTLPLNLHHKWLERDVSQMVAMNRAVDATTSRKETTSSAPPPPAAQLSSASVFGSQKAKNDAAPAQEDKGYVNGLPAAGEDSDDSPQFASSHDSNRSRWREKRRSLKKKLLGKISVSTKEHGTR